MAYQVLARKWRPQQFDDVVGQEHVTRTLKNAIKENRVAHAYLFVGPRGTGKTTTARIFAKALNCEKGPTPTPCNTCDACREIMNGTSMDVMEIDAASNTGVDHVRELRENARYTPVRGPFKVYVIDEVHMLSAGAFNALLKTLEEPPPHVKFVLATTDPQKVPATIHSRCQRFDLRRIATTLIAEAIGKIAKVEGVDIDEDALLAIARGAEGGMRDAQSALDQLISFIGTTIREPDVLSVFGLVARGTLEDLAGAVLEGDVPRLIQRVAELDESGKDMQRLIFELLEYFRNVLICLYAKNPAKALDMTASQLEVLQSQAATTSGGRVLQIVQILTETEGRLRYALSRRTLVETALIRAARAATVVSIEEILAELAALKEALGHGEGGAEIAMPASAPSTDGATKKKSPETVKTPAEPVEVPHATVDTEPPPVPAMESPEIEPESTSPGSTAHLKEEGPLSVEQLSSDHQRLFVHWRDVIERAGHAAPLVKNYLLDAKPLAVEQAKVVIGFDPEFKLSLDNVDMPRNRMALQKTISRFLGRDVGIEFKIMTPGDTLPADIKLPEGHSKDEEPEELTMASLTAEQRWMRDPAVIKTLETFNGEIIEIRE